MTAGSHALSSEAEKTAGARNAASAQASSRRPVTIPWFIALFVAASLAGTVIPAVHAVAPSLTTLAKTGVTVTLLLVGMSLSRSSLRAVGVRPVLHGIGLWLAIGVMALAAVRWAGI